MNTSSLADVVLFLIRSRWLLRHGTWSLVGLFIVGCSWFMAYGTGVLPTFGYKSSATVGTADWKPSTGTSWGVRSMYLVEGQTAWFRYDVRQIRDGALRLSIRSASADRSLAGAKLVRRRGKGAFAYRVPATGFYRFRSRPVPAGNVHAASVKGLAKGFFGATGIEADYSVKWGAHFPNAVPADLTN